MQEKIEEERNLLSNREYVIAIMIDERTRPPTTFIKRMKDEWMLLSNIYL